MLLKPRLKIVLLLLVFISLTACKDGINYQTNAIYKAEASNLTVHLKATGFILYGHDLDNDGIVKGYILSQKLIDTIYIQANEYELFLLSNKNDTIKTNTPSYKNVSIKHYLNTIHYNSYNPEELKELEKVIKATAYGPKGTYTKGQTDLIKTISVNFETHSGYQNKKSNTQPIL